MPQDFDVYLIGSDQLWSIQCLGYNIEPAYFGEFPHSQDSRVCSYAISSNIQSLETIGKEKLGQYLKNFNILSVREETIAAYILQATGFKARIDIDPTLLVDSTVWEAITPRLRVRGEYVLTYFLLPEQRKYAAAFARRLGLRLIEVGKVAMSPTDFLAYVKHATYIIGGSYVIACHAGELGNAFRLIFVAAFDPQAVMGGALGLTVAKAMQFGVARGLFSNEAGMGSTPHAHAVAKVEHPAEQGLVAIFGVFATLIVVTFTGIVILVTGVLDFQSTGIALTQKAYNVGLGSFGVSFVAICLFFFAYSTIIGWYFFAEQNVRFLFSEKALLPYRVIVCAFIIVGATLKVDLVWALADLFNGLMVIPNLIALIALHKVVGNCLDDFEAKLAKYEKTQQNISRS